jgi:hypothetical protein
LARDEFWIFGCCEWVDRVETDIVRVADVVVVLCCWRWWGGGLARRGR